jgi:hypothetical protein
MAIDVGRAQNGAQPFGVNPSVETVWNWHTCGSMVFPSHSSSSLSGWPSAGEAEASSAGVFFQTCPVLASAKRKTRFSIPCSSVLPVREAFLFGAAQCASYFFVLPDQHNEAVSRVSIFVEILMSGCVAPEPRCGSGIGDHCAGQYRSSRHAGGEKKLAYADQHG